MSHARPFVWLLALAALGLTTPGGAAQGPVTSGTACDASLPLRWIDGDRTSRVLLDVAEREASRIWAPAGITLDWAGTTPARPAPADAVLLVVREHLAGRSSADLRTKRRNTLGRVVLVTPDRPSRLIELLLPAVTTAVHAEKLFGRRIRDLPPASRELAVGRALGRVLAHELGHWLFGRAHMPAGLMRASIRRRDLVDPLPPALPAAWPSTARARLLERRRAVALPCPVRQSITPKGTVS